jgi:hypothetical protein
MNVSKNEFRDAKHLKDKNHGWFSSKLRRKVFQERRLCGINEHSKKLLNDELNKNSHF